MRSPAPIREPSCSHTRAVLLESGAHSIDPYLTVALCLVTSATRFDPPKLQCVTVRTLCPDGLPKPSASKRELSSRSTATGGCPAAPFESFRKRIHLTSHACTCRVMTERAQVPLPTCLNCNCNTCSCRKVKRVHARDSESTPTSIDHECPRGHLTPVELYTHHRL